MLFVAETAVKVVKVVKEVPEVLLLDTDTEVPEVLHVDLVCQVLQEVLPDSTRWEAAAVAAEVQAQLVCPFLSKLGALGTTSALGAVANASPPWLLLMILKATLKTLTLKKSE